MRCRRLGDSSFGAVVLSGRDEGGRTCANGLPIIPASVRMFGRFQRLQNVSHPALAQSVEMLRCSLAPNSVILVSEFYSTSLSECISTLSVSEGETIALQVISAISYLHSEGICVGTLRPHNILFCNSQSRTSVRLSHYGLSYVSADGADIVDQLPRGHGLAPEHLLHSDRRQARTTFKSDVWMLGITLLEIMTGVVLNSVWSLQQYTAVLQTCMRSASPTDSLLDGILQALQSVVSNVRQPADPLKEIVRECLHLKPSLRPSMASVFKMLKDAVVLECESEEDWETIEQMEARLDVSGDEWKISELSLSDAFFLWKLCGSSAESILIKEGVIKLQYPVMTTPGLVVEDFRMFGNEKGRQFEVNCHAVPLPMQNLREKLLSLSDSVFLHSIELDGLPEQCPQLSVVIKEKDVAYQLSRTRLVRHLVDGMSVHGEMLPATVAQDIPPLVRGAVWASLLGVRDGGSLDFLELDTLADHVSDRQLDVDIPRCHQYEELMSSPAAHWKLRRVIKGWLLRHPNYVYWQGCDSLAAPFLILHFNDNAVALSCLTAFIDKYLHNFFLKDNSPIIQEYLAVFNHLLAYVDSALYSKLVALDFYPELFAIPWFLTCFAHVLPLHKLFHVWDVLLLKDSSFPMFIGLAILRQLRPRLIEASFNDAILLFSDLPDLVMERVIADALMFFERVPPSCAFRAHKNTNHDSIGIDEPRGLPCSMAALSQPELRTWSCPQLSVEEFVWRVNRQTIVVIDVRSQKEFQRGSVVRSISYCNPTDPSLLNIAEALRVAQRNAHPICIIGGKDLEVAKKFSAMLVERGTDGVCVLDGGFERIRNDRSIIGI